MSGIISEEKGEHRRENVTIAPMRKILLIVTMLVMAGLLVGGLVYFSPALQTRLGWRMEIAQTYVRMALQPVRPLPTALPLPRAYVTRHPTQTPIQVTDLTPSSGPTPTPTLSPTPIPRTVQLAAPQYEKQTPNDCGPASLSMYLRFYGWQGSQADIAAKIKPFLEDRNVNIDEMVYYVRTNAGWLNVEFRVGGRLEILRKLIAAGLPVIIEEGMQFEQGYWPNANDDLWAAHYLLLTGYDDNTQTFIGQDSFYGANRPVSYTGLDETWQQFNRVYLLVYPPDREGIIQSILGEEWDPDLNRQRALEAAQAETQTQPENAFAWFNLGTNLVYFDRYSEASDAYGKARQLGLPQRMLRYQFGPFITYFHTGQDNELATIAKYALMYTESSEEINLWYGWALYRQGQKAEAIDAWRKALKAHPNYLDAEYALKLVGAFP